MARRRLEVEITGDSGRLSRELGRAESRLATFGRRAGRISGGGGLGGGMLFAGRGAGPAAAAALAAVGMKKAVDAAREAEVVLGQTSVAVKQAGIDWNQSAGLIDQAADRISNASAFDDEDVLRSFQVFVRGQKDVQKALDLSALAADVARARYTDLESATQLVNKAAMGQVGALRRAGIAIDKNATSQEALNELQRVFGGSAEKYADSAAASSERLQVAWENLAEEAGGELSEVLAVAAEGFTALARSINGAQLATEDLLRSDIQSKVRDAFGQDALTGLLAANAPVALGPGAGIAAHRAAQEAAKADKGRPAPIKGLSLRLQERILDARLKGTDEALLTALKDAQDVLAAGLSDARLKGKGRLELKQALLSVTDEIRGIQEDAADDARGAAEDAKAAAAKARQDKQEAARKQRDAMKKALEAAKEFQETLRERADALKDAALRAIDRKQEGRETARAITEAREVLARALPIGSPTAIRDARRDLENARLDRQRFLLEGATVSVPRIRPQTGTPVGGGFNVTINGLTLTGIQNPQDFLRALQRVANTQAPSRSGPYAGNRSGI